MALLKSLGVSAIRLRVWVNPEVGWCGKEDVVAKAVRAKNLGMKVMIDFHYSDSWADPGKQNKPAAWANLSLLDLCDAVAEHTRDVLNALKQAGVTPTWIQIGNETTGGMLWPTGQNYTDLGFQNYAELHNAGYLAAKQIFPQAYVMVHIDKGQDRSQLEWFLESCEKHSLKYDLVGLSLYPEEDNWREYLQSLFANIKGIYLTYGKDTMICEVGMSWTKETTCNTMLSALVSSCKHELEGHCHGVFYWEPEGYQDWSHYPKAAFDNNGKPTQALYAFSN
jgi:arabinogalactan endo-1,4-beta-galactosidase